ALPNSPRGRTHDHQGVQMGFRTTMTAVGGALIATGLLAGPVPADAETIKIAFLGSQEDEDYDGSLVFKDYVESRTNGELTVEIYPNGTFCSKFMECIEQVQSGVLEVTISTIGGFGNIFPAGQVLDLPYMFRDDRVAECVFDGPFTSDLRQAVLDEVGPMRLMTVSNTGGWRNFATVGKLIKSPDDVKGMKIRTIPADIQVELVKMLGGSPTPVSWPEVYTSLATGVVEGTKNGITDIVNMKFEEHLDYITLDGHAYMAALWWMNDEFFMNLPAEQRKVVHDGFQHLKTVTRALPMRRAIDAYETFKAADGEVYVPSPEEKQAFQEATAGMKDWFKSQYGDTWLIKLEKAVSDCEDEIDAEYAEFGEE
ncbi:MAG: TRAP transporter substrate-binding protein DctP, partial [Geminicoccaceae bacterium]|nr:TRAP transporter substrate-binding protein DctP [Geminicoccaceae bacterium]